MDDSLKQLSGLTAEQIGLLQLRLAELKKNARRSCPAGVVRRRPDSDVSRLSFAQQRIWFAAQVAPDSAAYNVIEGVRLAGQLSSAALGQAINEVIRRHEVLRTTFENSDHEATQRIACSFAFLLSQISLEGLSEIAQEAEIQRLSAEDARRPFDLTQSPLLRMTLGWLGADRYFLFLTMHHIVADFWSLGLLLRELGSLYERFLYGKPSHLSELAIQYRDYAEWQRDWLTGEVLDAQLSYWKQQLEGDLPRFELPIDGAPSSRDDFRGATHCVFLCRELSESLKSFCRRQGCTLTMALLAAFNVLLRALSGQDDIILGVTIANRNRIEIESLIGFFVNTLPLRTDLSGNPTFLELLDRVRPGCLEAYGHQDLPFEKLVEEIHPERTPARNPIFDILFNSLTAPAGNAKLPGLVLDDLHREDPESKFALTLNVEEFGDEIRLRAVYQSRLFSSERIEAMLDQYVHLLQQIADDQESPISAYSLVAPRFRRLLPDPTQAIAEPRFELAARAFASRAELTPDRPAIIHGDRSWTYGELSEAVCALVSSLKAQGLCRGDVVAVTGRRSFGLIAAVLAVLSSGGVLLTIDPLLPEYRKLLMVKEARPRRLICVGESAQAKSIAGEVRESIFVDPNTGSTPSVAQRLSIGDSFPESSPDDAAYIFFTSGTTGVPKAVIGCHKGLSHFLHWQGKEFNVGAGDRCAQLTNLSFDVVLRDILLPLTSGATLCLPDGYEQWGSERTLSWLDEQRITLLHVVPTLAQLWLARVPPGVSLKSLRCVFFAGEPLTDSLVIRWRNAFPLSGSIVNLYGPTETTLAKCFHRVSSEPLSGIQPIGKPIPETQVLIVSKDLRLCGVGELGQIAVRTPFRTLGYLNPNLEDQARFVPNPFREDERDRVYLTGDLGRYRLDGTIEIAGRLDHQIKIRGVRVEPDEITAVVLQHAGIESCAVVGVDDPNGGKALVAYVVRKSASRVTAGDLRSYLSKRLPSWIVPSRFIFLETLPLKPNGKFDWKALPSPEFVAFDLSEAAAPAASSIEEALCKLWADVLGLDSVGVEDNFFDLGGHSLLAMRIVSRVREHFKVDVPLQKLFENPTVRGLAAVLVSNGIEERPHACGGPLASAGETPDEWIEGMLASIEQLSDQQVDFIIGDLLAATGPDGYTAP